MSDENKPKEENTVEQAAAQKPEDKPTVKPVEKNEEQAQAAQAEAPSEKKACPVSSKLVDECKCKCKANAKTLMIAGGIAFVVAFILPAALLKALRVLVALAAGGAGAYFHFMDNKKD